MKPPRNLSNERYAMLLHGLLSLLVLAEIAGTSSIITDDLINDHDLNAAFDKQIEDYPWSP